MVIDFLSPAAWFNLVLFDWGSAGARVDAYSGLVRVDQSPYFYSLDNPGGQGLGNYATYSYAGGPITQLRIYQQDFDPGTGIGWDSEDGFNIDTLQFGTVPEPVSLLLVSSGLLAFGLYRRKRA
jgi:hypothetical protein